MAPRRSRGTLWLLLAALLLGAAGQFAWRQGEPALARGAALWGAALILYGVSLWVGGERPAWPIRLLGQTRDLVGRSWLRIVALVAALAASVLVGGAALRRAPGEPCWDLLAYWALVVTLALAAMVLWRDVPGRLAATWRRACRPTPELLAVLGLTVLAGFLRFWSLETIPAALSGDEASMGLEAAGVLAGTLTNPFATGWLSHPTLYFFLQAPFVHWFGRTVAALRISSALASTVTVPMLYLMARRWFGRRVALMATVFLVGYHVAIHFGRLGMNNTWDPALALGALYAIDRGIERHSAAWALLGGICVGLGAYFYMGARLVPLLVAAYLLLSWRGRTRYWERAVPVATLAVAGAAMVAMPLLMFWRAHPADMVARWKMLAIGPSGWLADEAVRRGVSEAVVFLGQLRKAALGWVLYTDPTFHYGATIPLLGTGSAVAFVFGLVAAARRWRHSGAALLLVWIGAVVLFGGALLENPPSSPRYVIAIPAAAMLVALGLDDLARRLGSLVDLPTPASAAVAFLVAVGLAVASGRYYFQTYTPLGIYGGHNTQVAQGIARHLQTLPSPVACYMAGAPRMYYGFATIPYLNPAVEGVDLLEPLKEAAQVPETAGPAVFVLLPERLTELDVIQERYPEGRLTRHHSAAGELLFASYWVEG